MFTFGPHTGPWDRDDTIEDMMEFGNAPALSPSLHTGDGYRTAAHDKAIVRTSDGLTGVIELKNPDEVRSGPQAWRQLTH